MKVTQVAAQLYTVREHMKTRDGVAASLKKVKEIGYQAVQVASAGAVSVEELAGMLQEVGLACAGAHEDAAKLVAEPKAAVASLKKLGARHIVYPHPAVKLETLADVQALAASLNAAGKVVHEAGMVLAYHNHSVEFRRFDGRLALDVLYEETDPRYLQGEIDTYWVQHGGGDPADWCRKLKGRMPLLHLKDYAISAERRPTFAEIGYGNLNFKEIVAAADEVGCEWYTVEQDVCPGDPFDSLKMSFEYIRDNLCS